MLFRQQLRRPDAPRSAAWSPSASRTARSPTSPPRSPGPPPTAAGRRRSRPLPGLARRRPRTSAATARRRRRSATIVVERRSDGWTRLDGPGLRPGAAGPAPRAGARRRHRPPGLRGQRRRRRRAAPPRPTPLMVDAVTGEVLVPRRTRSSSRNDAYAVPGRASPRPSAARSTRSSSPTTTTRQIVAVAAMRGQRGQRHRGQALRPRRRRCSPAATCGTSPEAADLHRRRPIPAGHLHVAGLPVRRPDRPVRCRRATTPACVTTCDSRRRDRRRPAPAAVALLHREPDARLLARRRRPTNTVVGCWIRGRGLHAADRRARNVAARRPVGLRSPRPARRPSPPRQQRQHPRGVGQPADPGRPVPGAGLADAGVHRRVHRRLEQLQVRPDPAASRAATTSTPR